MIGLEGKQSFLIKTKVTVSADGTKLSAGATITFPKPFNNMPAAVVIPPLGTVDLDAQVGTVWTLSALSTTACTIDVTTLPDNYFSKDLIVGVFVHEQL
jgi:hypothetical protein